jgi:enterochelin esterase-like enzyme
MKRLFPILLLALLAASPRAETLTVTTSQGQSAKTGNLIVVLSPREFRADSPGLMNVYAGKMLVDEGYTTGETVTFELPQETEGWYAGAYLDENRNFMWRGLPDATELYSSKVARLSTPPPTITVDAKRTPRTIKTHPWARESSFLSSILLEEGFSREEATQNLLVVLPPGYWTSQESYPVLFVSHGFNGDRRTYSKRYNMWRAFMKEKPMIIVSMDSFGRFGHHLFLNSEANGSRFDVFTREIVPFIDQHWRTNGTRIVYGQSSGGWTAISLLRRAPELIHGAVATGPDPLEFDDWWMGENQNLYTNPDGSVRKVVPAVGLTMKRFVDVEVRSRSYGQFAGFLAPFSPYRPDIQGPFPFESPFDLQSGALRPEIWSIWKENDMGEWARSHPDEARGTFSNRLALVVGDQDEFGLYNTTLKFSQTLKSLGIPHQFKVVADGGHSDYLEEEKFVKECWTIFTDLAHSKD